MSLDARNMTQGGQVIKYMLSMFLQITNLIVYWTTILGVITFFSYLLSIMKWIYIKNGLFYFYIKHVVLNIGLGSKENIYKNEYVVSVLENNNIIEKKLTVAKIIDSPYFVECGRLLKENAFEAFGVGLFIYLFSSIIIFYYLGRKGAQQRKNDIIGGRYLAKSVKDVNRYLKARGEQSYLKIGDLHIVKDSETQNIGAQGSVGTGKSTIINSFLAQVQAANQRATIYDKGNNFIKLFYRDGKDIILNPMDARCPRWDLWLECLDKADFESFALPLVPDSKGDPFWNMSARRLFVSTAEKMREDPDRSIKKLLDRLLSFSLADLQKYVEGTDASSLIDGSVEKTAMTIRAVLGAYVNALRYCEHLDNVSGEPFAIRDWVHNADQNSWIFISSDGRLEAALKPLITTWINILMQSILSLSVDRKRRIWTVLDELASLGKLPKLQDFMQEARKFGGVTFISIQNFPQLEELYGTKSASAIWDLCNTTIYFRAPSSSVAEWVQKEIGEIHHNKFQDQYSYGVDTIRDGVNFSKNDTRDKIVSYSDIQNLNDLECYVSLKGDYPVVKLKLAYKAYPEIAEGKIERRDIDISKVELVTETNEDEFVDKVFNTQKSNNDGSETGNVQSEQQSSGIEKVMTKPKIADLTANPKPLSNEPIEVDPNEKYNAENNIIKKNKDKDDDGYSNLIGF